MSRIDSAYDSDSIVEEARIELMSVTQNEDNSQDAFIVHSDLKAIWSKTRVQSFLKLCCGCPESHLAQLTTIIIDHYLKVVSVLIHISWVRWQRFTDIFLGNSLTWEEARKFGRSDEHLPFTSLPDLKAPGFLGSFGFQFHLHQYFFLPIRIGERRFNARAEYTEDYRLPALKTELLGSGASGIVYKETIAPGCIALGSGTWNSESFEVARKHIETQEDFDSESGIIQQLKENRLRHQHITRCYGVVVRQGRHQNKLDIFYELASSNLSQFLSTQGRSIPSAEVQQHLLTQSFFLIDALVLCHEQFYDHDQGHVILAHNDLKPENILVFYDAYSPVGIWKIADFGLSKVKPVYQENNFLSTDNNTKLSVNQGLSRSKATRPPGGYTAPEIVRQGGLLKDSNSVQCDIWSLGCILAQVLVFAVGGSQAVQRFNDLRLPNPSNEFNYHDDRYFEVHPEPESLRFKKPLLDILLELCDPSLQRSWVQQLVNLVLDILKVDRDVGKILSGPRPKASDIRERFRAIQRVQKLHPGSPSPLPAVLSGGVRDSFSTISTEPNIEPNNHERTQSIAPSTSSVTGSTFSSLDQAIPPPARPIQLPKILINEQPPLNHALPAVSSKFSPESSQATSPTSSIESRSLTPLRSLPIRPLIKSPSINISCTNMKAVTMSADARFAAFWSQKRVVVYSLSSAVREQLLDYSMTSESSLNIHSTSIFGDTLTVTLGGSKTTEIRFFDVLDEKKHQRKALYESLKIGEPDRFRRVLLGINNTVVLIYSDCIRIGSLQANLQDFRMINCKSETEIFFQPSVSLDGHLLVVCSRDPMVPLIENWHFLDISVAPEAVKDICLGNPVPHPDAGGPTSPSLMIPLQDTVGIYYSSGTLALFEGIDHGCKLEKNLICAAATASGPGFPETQLVVYIVQKQVLLSSKSEVWCAEIQRSRSGTGGRVQLKRTSKLLDLPRKLKSPPSMGFNWTKSAEQGPRIFCVILAFPDGSIRCLELPWVKPRWLE